MRSEWETISLGDCVELTTGFPFKSSEYSDDWDAVRLLRGDNIGQGALRWDNAKKWPISKTEGLENYEMKEADIVLAMDRPWIPAGLKFGRVRKNDLPTLLVQRVARLRPTTRINGDYLFSILASTRFSEYIQNVITGTAVPHISAKQIKGYCFQLPDSQTQKHIGQFHAHIDDRITLLRETNKTLESIAQAIFKSWFVDFDPVRAKMEGRAPEGIDEETAALFPDGFEESELGLVPRGWRVGSINDLCSLITNGGTPSRSRPEFWANGNIPWYKTGEFNDGFMLGASEHITEAALENSSAKLLPEYAILMAIYAAPTVGRLGILTKSATFNQACTGMVAKSEVGTWYLYWSLFFGRTWFNNRANGAAQQNISKGIVTSYPVIVPSESVLASFHEIVAKLHDGVRTNAEMAANLSALRDTLLPRLISGRLRLPETETIVSEYV